MNSSVPSPSTILEEVDRIAPLGTPLTTSEVAERFDCTDRTVYNRLDTLVDNGVLETKKVGARGRVWWRPLYNHPRESESEATDIDNNDDGPDGTRDRLRRHEEELTAELDAAKQLQEISTRLIQKDDIDTLYDEILDAVVTIMDADFARLQLYDPDRGDLQLLAHSGFDEAPALWERVSPESNGPCSVALETGQRVIVSDVETCEFMAGTEDRETLLETGIRAVQSTPLVSRSGDLIGMISTHWETPHEPSERELRSLDVLARQATDLIGQQQAKEDLRRNQELLAGQKRALERLVQGASLDDVLATLIRVIDEYTEGMLGSILIVQPGEERFGTVIGPDLPQSYTEALRGASISRPYVGPCGKAANENEAVVCERVESDTRWASEWRELALSHDLHGCYSTPIVGTDTEVLGSFGLYSTRPGDVVPSQDVRGVISDIAGVAIERKRTEEALRKSEERYRTLFESMTEGFCIIEMLFDEDDEPADYRFLETNPAFETQTGLTDVEGEWMRDLVPDHEDHWFEIYGEIARTGESKRFEAEANPLIDGWYDVHAFRYGGQDSRNVAILFDDITERKEAEEELRKREERYRELFESMTEGFCVIERVDTGPGEPVDFRYVKANPAFADHSGIDDVVGRTIRDVIPEEAQGWIETYDTVVQSGEAKRFERELVSQGRIQDLHAFPVGDGSTGRVGVIFRDVTDRKRRTEALREANTQLRTATSAGSVGLWTWDVQEGTLTADEFVAESYDLDPDTTAAGASAKPFFERIHEDDRDQVRTKVERAVEDTGVLDIEYRVRKTNGDIMWLVARGEVEYDENGEAVQMHGAISDITERKETEEALKRANDGLERLTTVSRELMDASPQAITDRAAELTRTVLDVEYSALWRYDENTGEFSRHARHTSPEITADAIRYPDGFSERVWRSFIHDETAIENDLPVPEDEREETRAAGAALRSYTLVPLPGHGVICAGSTHAGTFDEQTIDLTRTLGATLETAWNRAAGERRLARQNEELARLDRLNRLIREIDTALVQADSRAAIERAVCDRLAASDQYAFVWIGEPDSATETITPREWAGVDSSYVDDLSIPTDNTAPGPNPVAAAARTRDTQVVADIATETRFAPLREATLERGARSCLGVPLVYDDSMYGVLAIYADHTQSDERDHAVLAELGRTIAHAIDAVETRETLRTDRVVELTLQCREPNTPLCRLARQAGCEIQFEGLVYQSDGEPDVFFTASGVSAEELSTASEQVRAIRDLLCLTDQADTALFRARVAEPTLISRIVEQDAVVRTLTIEDGAATAVVDVPHTATVREFIERLQRDAPDLKLLARQMRDRPIKTRSSFQAICQERLTSKQLSALETAYFSGFFESPRVRTGQEVAASLGVSQPTFTTHLRAAQRGICDLLFDAPQTTADA